jgi:hypothetical protein
VGAHPHSPIDSDPSNADSARYERWLIQVLDSIVRFLEAETGTSLDALGLRAWTGRECVYPDGDERAPSNDTLAT